MTRKQIPKTDRSGLRLMAAGALVFASACAAPMLATDTRWGADAAADTGGLRCGIATVSTGAHTTFRPWVRLDPPDDTARAARYAFALAGGGTVIDQGGAVELGEGGPHLLGEATVTGPASGYDVELTVTYAGTRYRCYGGGDDI